MDGVVTGDSRDDTDSFLSVWIVKLAKKNIQVSLTEIMREESI